MAARTGYSGLQIGLHWIIAILVGINYLTGESMITSFDGMLEGTGESGGFAALSHQYLGAAVLVLVVLRFIVRMSRGAPEAPHDGPAILNTLGGLAHWALYALLLIVPAIGGYAWYLGVEEAGDLHVLVMNVMMLIILLHSLAALFHHFILRDGLLNRMMRPN